MKTYHKMVFLVVRDLNQVQPFMVNHYDLTQVDVKGVAEVHLGMGQKNLPDDYFVWNSDGHNGIESLMEAGLIASIVPDLGSDLIPDWKIKGFEAPTDLEEADYDIDVLDNKKWREAEMIIKNVLKIPSRIADDWSLSDDASCLKHNRYLWNKRTKEWVKRS